MAQTKSRPTSEDPATAVTFSVTVDPPGGNGLQLGSFTSCEGLGIEVVTEQREEGGQNGYVHQFATRLKFGNIKLTRPLTSDTEKVAKWFMSIATGAKRSKCRIVAMRTDGSVVAQWQLDAVIPVRWTGPSLSLESAKVATETIEIAHHGFLEVTGA